MKIKRKTTKYYKNGWIYYIIKSNLYKDTLCICYSLCYSLFYPFR